MGTVLALVAMAGSAWAAEPTRRYALLVGANDGGAERAVLRYAHQDAEALRAVLSALGGIDAADQRVLLDPSLAELTDALDALRDDIAADLGRSEVVFYYSGHSDETGLLLGEDHFEYPALRAQLEALPAEVRLAILDSCASGAMIQSKGGRRVAPFLIDESSQVGGFAMITSSSATEVAQEGERIGGSYFTHYLTTGLRGAADQSGDGRVDLSEAYAFAYDATLAHTEKTQYGPQHAMKDMNLSGKGDLVLTDLQLTSASLVLDASLDGAAIVRDADGHVMAELQRLSRSVELGLGEGRYTVTLTQKRGKRYGTAEVDLAPGMSTLVGPDDLQWFEGERTVARGDIDPDPPQAALSGAVNHGTVPMRMHIGDMPPPPGVDTVVFGPVFARSSELDGLSAAGGPSLVDGTARGLQTSLVVAKAGTLHGMQAGLVYNEAGGGDGWQSSVAANVVSGTFVGVQGTLGVNVATGTMDGLQSASVNVADELRGAQIGLINIGSQVGGLQLGLVNVATDVNGAQIGLINVARDVKGTPVGLISYERNGRHDVLLYASESDLGNVDLKLGGKHLYTLLGAGGFPGSHAYVHGGAGVQVTLSERAWLDLDAAAAAYFGADFDPAIGPVVVPRGRGTLGLQLAPQLAPFVGVSVNVRVPHEQASAPGVAPAWLIRDTGDVGIWPGLFAGVQF